MCFSWMMAPFIESIFTKLSWIHRIESTPPPPTSPPPPTPPLTKVFFGDHHFWEIRVSLKIFWIIYYVIPACNGLFLHNLDCWDHQRDVTQRKSLNKNEYIQIFFPLYFIFLSFQMDCMHCIYYGWMNVRGGSFRISHQTSALPAQIANWCWVNVVCHSWLRVVVSIGPMLGRQVWQNFG